MSKGKFIILFLGVFIVGLFVIFYANKVNYKNNETVELPVTQKSPYTNIAIWDSYEDKDAKITFKHPANFKISRGEELEEPHAYSFNIILPSDKLEVTEVDAIFMAVIPLEAPEKYGTSTDDILNKLSNNNANLKQIDTINGSKIFFDTKDGNNAFYVGEKAVFHIVLEGYNKSISTKADINIWENDYPHYVKLMEGIFSTFEVSQ
ncbi:MAG: hypothetical protein RLZZ230_228 [Candidatus Parcubacteria bacterium]|jgi:hypothetical protein